MPDAYQSSYSMNVRADVVCFVKYSRTPDGNIFIRKNDNVLTDAAGIALTTPACTMEQANMGRFYPVIPISLVVFVFLARAIASDFRKKEVGLMGLFLLLFGFTPILTAMATFLSVAVFTLGVQLWGWYCYILLFVVFMLAVAFVPIPNPTQRLRDYRRRESRRLSRELEEARRQLAALRADPYYVAAERETENIVNEVRA